MPLSPEPAPLMERLRSLTVSLAPALMMTPLDPAEASMEPTMPPPSMVIDFVIVTMPKPAGSRTDISPPAAVLEIAPAKVLQGAVRLQGFTSSPTPDTHVLVACACAIELKRKHTANTASAFNISLIFFM